MVPAARCTRRGIRASQSTSTTPYPVNSVPQSMPKTRMGEVYCIWLRLRTIKVESTKKLGKNLARYSLERRTGRRVQLSLHPACKERLPPGKNSVLHRLSHQQRVLCRGNRRVH